MLNAEGFRLNASGAGLPALCLQVTKSKLRTYVNLQVTKSTT
jgi:hypothetical protein